MKKIEMTKVIIGILCLFLSSCISYDEVNGNGILTHQKREISAIHSVVVEGNIDVYLSSTEGDSIEIIAESNILSVLETEVENGVLVVSFKSNTNVKENYPVEVYVSSAGIENLKTVASGNIVCDSLFSSNQSEVVVTASGAIQCDYIDAPICKSEVTGSGRIDIQHCRAENLEQSVSASGDITTLDAVADNVSIAITGSGSIYQVIDCNYSYAGINSSGTISQLGTAQTSKVKITGSGTYNGFGFTVYDCNVSISASGDANVDVIDNLLADITGSGMVVYEGNPSVEKHISGSGEVRSK